jgi:hypothetical protein
MANVADTKLYDILGVPPGASENELKKVSGAGRLGRVCGSRGLRGRVGQAALRGGPRANAGHSEPGLGGGGVGGTGRLVGRALRPRLTLGLLARPQMQQIKPTSAQTR